MRRTFNCGVGMIAVVGKDNVDRAIGLLESGGERAWRLGVVAAGAGGVRYR
jgi:phosphoribosylformylglycinamidine cyclo-ligase